MIVCPRCGKENQDHYKFCLGCGAELPAAAADARPESRAAVAIDSEPAGGAGRQSPVVDGSLAKTAPPDSQPPQTESSAPPQASVEFRGGGSEAVAIAATAPTPIVEPPVRPVVSETPSTTSQMLACPGCNTENPAEFTFCGNCGARLKQAPAAQTLTRAAQPEPNDEAAPRPAVLRLSLIRPDGSEGGSHLVHGTDVTIGRGSGPLFDNDSYLSPQHARIFVADSGDLVLEDAGSLNGVFVRITGDEELASADVFRIGQELLRYDAIEEPQPQPDGTEVLGSPNPGYWGRLSLIVRRGVDGSSFPLMGDEMLLGRERGDILFSDDGYVSGQHSKLARRGNRVFLVDLGSSNGTFIRLRRPRPIPYNTFVLMGQQLFRIDEP